MKPRYLFPSDYMADPSANVFNGKLYIYPSHDREAGHTVDDNGNPLKAGDPHRFFEASWMHKYKDKYYFLTRQATATCSAMPSATIPMDPSPIRVSYLTP